MTDSTSQLVVQLQPGKKCYINGACISVDTKTDIRIHNDARLLLDKYVLAKEEVTTPMQKLYFLIQGAYTHTDEWRNAESFMLIAKMAKVIPAKYEGAHEFIRSISLDIIEGKFYLAMTRIKKYWKDAEPYVMEHCQGYRNLDVTVN